jgi:phage portal protein BeeE
VAAGLLDRIAAERGAVAGAAERRFSVDQWISDYLIPSVGLLGFGGNQYTYGLNQTYDRQRVQQIPSTLPGYSAALRSSPPAFAAQMVRAMVMSQARFVYRNPPWHRTPRRVFGSARLRLLERPWPGASTGELLSRMEWHAGLAGSAYVVRQPNRLRVIRPDWTGVLFGSELEPDDPAGALDAELLGYVYQNGGLRAGNNSEPVTLLPSDVAHWSPIPDPEIPEMGQSWVTATLREIQGDSAATEHKLNFFRNGATPNMVVKGLPAVTREQFNDMVDMLEERHTGLSNAYRTLYLVAGADATVVGADLKQIDFKQTQGAGETRISLVGRVPAALLGISEGLAGSALNAGNFGMARRMFADTWLYPTLQDVAGTLAQIVDVPDDAELWFDTTDIPLLREDGKDAAEIEQIKSQTITQYVREGFTPESAVAATNAQDVKLLVHTGLVSVQLQPPGITLGDDGQNGEGSESTSD